MSTPLEVSDTQIAEWQATGHSYKVIAAEIAEWALQQARGTPLPGNDHFAGDLNIVASASTWKRPKALLAAAGVLHAGDGPYRVA
jgi:hypothetical protein